MKNRKCFILIGVIVIAVLLSSCQWETNMIYRFFFVDTDGEFCDNRIEQLFKAFENSDKGAIRDVFSKKAISEADEFDDSIDMLVEFLKGQPISWSRDEAPVVMDRREKYDKQKHYTVWFMLKTAEEKYWVFLSDYPIDELDSNNEGLFSLKVIEADDEEKLDGTIEEWGAIPGISIGID